MARIVVSIHWAWMASTTDSLAMSLFALSYGRKKRGGANAEGPKKSRQMSEEGAAEVGLGKLLSQA